MKPLRETAIYRRATAAKREIRELTQADWAALTAARERFVARHESELLSLNTEDGYPAIRDWESFWCHLWWHNDPPHPRQEALVMMWRNCMRRALRCPEAETFAGGSIWGLPE